MVKLPQLPSDVPLDDYISAFRNDHTTDSDTCLFEASRHPEDRRSDTLEVALFQAEALNDIAKSLRILSGRSTVEEERRHV